jgi:hypothetical protein
MANVRTPRLILAASLVLGLLAVAGCGTTTSPSPSFAPTSSLAPPSTGQTDTEWGRIWDSVPAGFPIYPGSTPADETAQGPASATFVVDGDVANEAATRIAEGIIPAVTSGTTEIEGPLEDGTYVVHFDGDGDCRVQVSASPLGSVTTITVLYGSLCPAP